VTAYCEAYMPLAVVNLEYLVLKHWTLMKRITNFGLLLMADTDRILG